MVDADVLFKKQVKMQNLLYNFFLSILISHYCVSTFGQCPDYFLATDQVEIDSFPLKYPDCDSIEGMVWIDAVPPIGLGGIVTDLSPLYQIKYIGGDLEVFDTDIKTIEFPNLEYINGYFTISDNDELVEIEGIGNLKNIKLPYGLYIGHNDKLKSISIEIGSKIEGRVDIVENDSLNYLSLPFIDSIKYFNLKMNPFLQDVNMSTLQYISKDLVVEENYMLNDLDWVSNIDFIGEQIVIKKANYIDSVDLSKILGINKSIRIDSNELLKFIEFNEEGLGARYIYIYIYIYIYQR